MQLGPGQLNLFKFPFGLMEVQIFVHIWSPTLGRSRPLSFALKEFELLSSLIPAKMGLKGGSPHFQQMKALVV